MSYQWPAALALHQIGTIIWIGGMFFAHVALRPTVNQLLDPPVRLPLMLAVFTRFFPWVWVAIALLWTSGLWVFLGLFGGKAPIHVHVMMGLAAVMTAIFVFIWSVPFRKMGPAVEAEDWAGAGARLGLIRKLILTNLLLGLVTAMTGAAGPHLSAALATH
jgi:uncharacterized membrane protein